MVGVAVAVGAVVGAGLGVADAGLDVAVAVAGWVGAGAGGPAVGRADVGSPLLLAGLFPSGATAGSNSERSPTCRLETFARASSSTLKKATPNISAALP